MKGWQFASLFYAVLMFTFIVFTVKSVIRVNDGCQVIEVLYVPLVNENAPAIIGDCATLNLKLAVPFGYPLK